MVFLFLIPISLYAQNYQLKGTVIDPSNEPLIGANVSVKGTTNGTITDVNGSFVLNVSPKATIVVSFMGFDSQEINVNAQKNLKIVLKENAKMLDETIVIGYGTMKKSDMTGAISSVDVKSLSARATTNPIEALQGKVAGVSIQKSGGNAGAGMTVKIRGVKTMGTNAPLYIIDGFQGDIETVNPNDIGSMEVLKDGAAAAIYGSRAANGVIIITTKNGKKGELKVDFDAYANFRSISKNLEMLNADEYKAVHKQMYENAGNKLPAYIGASSNVDTNWMDVMSRNGITQNYTMSVRGGSENAQFSVSYNHEDAKGVFLGDDFKQDNARMKLRMTKKIFDFDTNMSLRITDSKNPSYNLKEVYMISPLVPVYDTNEEKGFGLTNFNELPNNNNPMADHTFHTATNKSFEMAANAALTVNFTKDFNFKTSYSYRGVHERSSMHTPAFMSNPQTNNEYVNYSEGGSYWNEQIIDNVMNYSKKFGEHSLNAMIGSSISTTKYNVNNIKVEGKTIDYSVKNGALVTTEKPAGFLNPYFTTLGAGNGGTYTGNGTRNEYNRVSYFGRLNYSYGSKYLFQATLRRDASSKFGKNSRWGTFPSVALGWRISEEAFFPKDMVLNNLKLRGSWGRLGNEVALGYYDFQALIISNNQAGFGYVQGGNPWNGTIATDFERPNLHWETTDNKNIGFDFGFFNNKLVGAINYYRNETSDLLVTKLVPLSDGFASPVLNVGKLRNSGIEFEANYADSKGDFNYNIGLNLTTTKNEVISLADANQMLSGIGLKYNEAPYPNATRTGYPVGSFFLYKTNGLFQSDKEVADYKNGNGDLLQPDAQPGDIRFIDMNGDGTIDSNDKVDCGSGIPKLEVNLTLGGSYKGFDLSMLIGSAWGNKLFNANKYYYEGMASGSNFLKSTLNAWTPQNTNTTVPRAVLSDPNSNTRESDRYVESGNFVRLRQIQLGYTLPKSILNKLSIDKLRVYVTGENLLTLTNYSGIDPEFATGILSSGVESHVYPFTRSCVVGVQLSF